MKAFMSKKKTLTAVIASLVAVVIMLGGTFAWQSISQTALNEIKSTVNPGGRLHDDFVEITADGYNVMTYNKDVYAENFTSLTNNGVQIYARVRLDEYMEFGKNAGGDTANEATPLVAGTNLADKSTWSTYKFNEDSAYRDYFDMTFAGKTVYMPTFNKDMNSLEADINGTFENNFTDHTDYALGDEVTANATYAAQDDDGTITTTTKEETHTAAETLNSFIMPMDDYLAAVEAGTLDGNAFDGKGDFWVYDNDGWAYWANPINPDTATGLLLNGINRTEEIINNDWYYAINVVAQFITYDDMGQNNNTGFYDTSNGNTAPTADALDLLNRIGVKVNYNVETAAELEKALANGGTVTLTDDITLENAVAVKENTVLNLGGHKITTANDLWNDSEENGVWSLISVDGATLTVNGNGTVEAKENDSFCVDVRNGGKVVINGGKFVGNISAVYVKEGEAAIYGGEFSIMQLTADNEYDEMLNCYDANYANGTAKITVCGGAFTKFNPEASNDGSFVKSGYSVSHDADTDTYTVAKDR